MTAVLIERKIFRRLRLPLVGLLAVLSIFLVRFSTESPSPFTVGAYAAVTGASQHIVAVVRSDFAGTNLWGEVDIEGLSRPLPPDAVLDAGAIDEMVRKSIELACIDDGSLSAYFDADDWVCIVLDAGYFGLPAGSKDFEEQTWTGAIADLRLVKSFLGLLASEKGGKRISLFASAPPEFWRSTWKGHYGGLSYETIVKELSALYPDIAFEMIQSNADAPKEIEVGEARDPAFKVPEALTSCDKLVSIASLKTHALSRVSMNVMNYFQFLAGVIPAAQSSATEREGLEATAVDLFSFRPPQFALIDGISGCAVINAAELTKFKGNLVLAGKDPVAVDAAGAMLLGRNPWDVGHFHLAAGKGIGTFDPDSMDIRGTPMKDAVLALKAVLPGIESTYTGRGIRRWLVNGIYEDAGLEDLKLEDEPFLYPEPGDEEGGKVWQECMAADDFINLANVAPNSLRNGLSYVYTPFLSSVEEDGFAWFSGHGVFLVYFNDEEIFRQEAEAGEMNQIHKIPIPVKRGYNHLLLKAVRTGPDYGFGLQIIGPDNDGNTMRGLKFLEP